MDDIVVAKSLLLSDNEITNIIKFKVVDIDILNKTMAFTGDKLVNIKIYCTSVVDVTNFNRLQYTRLPGFAFSDWHIKNQTIERNSQPCFTWGKIILYKNELLETYIDEFKYEAEQIVINPFENKFYEKINNVSVSFYIKASIDIAKIYTASEFIYFINRSQINASL